MSNNHDYWNNRGQTFDKNNKLEALSSDKIFEISAWNVPWFRSASVIGINPSINIDWGNQQVVAPQGGQYTFPASATTFYISSTNTWDTANTFLLTLLDEDYNEVNITVTPNWQNAVAVSWGPYLRLNFAVNITWNASQGDIYISTSPTNTGGVPPAATILWEITFEDYGTTDSSAERLHNAVYTVPAWKTFFPYNIRAWLWKNKDAIIYIYIKPFGGVFIENIRYQLYEWNFENALYPLTPIAEKTDVEFRATTSNNATELTVNVSFVLVDNDKL